MSEEEITIQDSNVYDRIQKALHIYRANHIRPLGIALGPTEFLSWVLIESQTKQIIYATTICGNGCWSPEYKFEDLPLYAIETDGVHVLTDLTGSKRIAAYREKLRQEQPFYLGNI